MLSTPGSKGGKHVLVPSAAERKSGQDWSRALLLSCAFFGCFVAHDFLQELIVKTPGWHFPLVMTMLEFGACCLMPLLLEQPLAQPAASRPLRSYAALTACVMSSAAMANLSLQYVNYPVKVIFKSTKLLGAMAVGVALLPNKRFSRTEFAAAALLCAGLVGFVLAEQHSSSGQHTSTSVLGLLLLTGAVLCDSLNPILQEQLMQGQKRPHDEVMFFTNLLGSAMLLLGAGLAGELGGALDFVLRPTTQQAGTLPLLACFGLATYFGVRAYMLLVAHFGGVFAVTVSTSRKVATVVLSFAWFRRAVTWQHALSGLAMLGSVALEQRARALKKAGRHQTCTGREGGGMQGGKN